MTNHLRIFVPSPASRLFPQVSNFLNDKGLVVETTGRELFLQMENMDVFLARGFDIPKIVEQGWGDLGITGLDAVAETQVQVLVLRELGIRFSDVVLASTRLNDVDAIRSGQIVVTEYPKLTQAYFQRRAIDGIDLFRVTGGAEAFGGLQEVSCIVTLKTSGRTLRDNKFMILDTIFRSQVCLIANRYSVERKSGQIQWFLASISTTGEISNE